MMSSAFKKQLSPILQEGFVVKRAVFQPCLELYPMQEWNEVMHKVNSLNRFVKKNNDFIRRFTAGVRVIELDASGRLLIPKDLCQFAGIQKQIVLSSAINIIEIWDKDNYEKTIDAAAEDFATYRYLVGVGQTLADMKDRFHQEYVKMIKQETGE